MKKTSAILMALIAVIFLGQPVYGDMLSDKLEGYWLKDELDKDFLVYYFPYIAKDNYEKLNFNGSILENEFTLSFSSLLKEKGYSTIEIGWGDGIERIKAVKIISDKLLELEVAETTDNIQLPFTDIEDLEDENTNALLNLYSLGIVKGQSNSKFNPHANMTQAEAIVMLQRVSTYLDDLETKEEVKEEVIEDIPFTLLGSVQSYTGTESIVSKIEGDKVLVTVTKQFPTPGYTVVIDKIEKHNDEIRIYLNTSSPKEDAILPQVITYKMISIEIDKKYLGQPPYKFVWGDFLL